jgi:DNA-binding CsgD family transcriptional regulator
VLVVTTRRSSPARRAMFDSVKRACYSAYGTTRLSEEVTTRLQTGLRIGGSALSTTDPELGVLTGTYSPAMTPEMVEVYTSVVYPSADALAVIDMATNGTMISRERPAVLNEVLSDIGARIHVAALDSGTLWGWLCLIREAGAPQFDGDEGALLTRLAPHLGAGLRRAAQLDAARRAHGDSENPVPGVMVVTAEGRVALRDGGAARLAGDLTDTGWDQSRPPPAVAGAVARLYAAEDRAQPGDDVALEGVVRAQGRSGRWYEITASRADTDADAVGRSIVVIAPVGAEGLLRIISRLYGLTPRERDVLQRVARGQSTKAIARALELSPYTVQEHIGNASDKVGVRGRRELVGRLFLDGLNR